MSDENRHGIKLALKHQDDIEELFDIANEHTEELHELKTKIAKMMGEEPPPPLERRPSAEEMAEFAAKAAKEEKKAKLLADLAALEGNGGPAKKAAPSEPKKPTHDELLAARRAKLGGK